MANKRITSEPLFGRATAKDVKAIQKHMDAHTARLLKNADKAREVLRRTGAADGPEAPKT
jgi:hypothetical protein